MAPERDVFEPVLDAKTRENVRQGWRFAVEKTRLHDLANSDVQDHA
jgi:hypothetical protein